MAETDHMLVQLCFSQAERTDLLDSGGHSLCRADSASALVDI